MNWDEIDNAIRALTNDQVRNLEEWVLIAVVDTENTRAGLAPSRTENTPEEEEAAKEAARPMRALLSRVRAEMERRALPSEAREGFTELDMWLRRTLASVAKGETWVSVKTSMRGHTPPKDPNEGW